MGSGGHSSKLPQATPMTLEFLRECARLAGSARAAYLKGENLTDAIAKEWSFDRSDGNARIIQPYAFAFVLPAGPDTQCAEQQVFVHPFLTRGSNWVLADGDHCQQFDAHKNSPDGTSWYSQNGFHSRDSEQLGAVVRGNSSHFKLYREMILHGRGADAGKRYEVMCGFAETGEIETCPQEVHCDRDEL